ncbi:MAG: hypothetical protein NVSMB16_08330 [Acidimicrobiales bacterium]
MMALWTSGVAIGAITDRGIFRKVLLPRTDAAAELQTALVTVVSIVAFVKVRRDPDLRLFVAGVIILVFAFLGVRALH